MDELISFLLISLLVLTIVGAVAGITFLIIDEISTFLKKAKSKKEKQSDKLKRVLQKSIQKIGSKDTLKNLKMAMYQIDGLVEFKDKLIALANEKEIFELRMETACKDYRIKRLEDALERARNENSDNGNAGRVPRSDGVLSES